MRRVLVTIGLVLAVLLLQWVPVPGLDPELYELAPHAAHLGALELRPLVSSFVFVELVALIIPSWRRRRVHRVGRARLTRMAVVIGVLFGIFQAFSMAQWVFAHTTDGLTKFSKTDAWLMVASLSGTVALTAWLGSVLSERGLGCGFSVLIGAFAANGLIRSLVADAQARPDELLRIVGVNLLFVLAWAGVLTGHQHISRFLASLTLMPKAPDERRHEPSTMSLWLPASGFYPLPLLRWWSSLALAFPLVDPELLRLAQLPTASPWGHALIVGASALCFSWLFHRPRLMADAAEQLGLDGEEHELANLRTSAKRAALTSALIMVAFALAMDWLSVDNQVLQWGIVVAVGLDLTREWRSTQGRDFVRVADLHRVYVAIFVSQELTKAGVPFVIRGLHHRTLGQVLTPYVPMTVLVPSSRAAKARKLVGDIC